MGLQLLLLLKHLASAGWAFVVHREGLLEGPEVECWGEVLVDDTLLAKRALNLKIREKEPYFKASGALNKASSVSTQPP